MKRAMRIFAGATAAVLILGCHEKRDSDSPVGAGGGSSAPLAYAPTPEESAPPAPNVLKDLVARAQSSEYGGAAPGGGIDAGRELFDGARASGGGVLPVSYAYASGTRRGLSSTAAAAAPSPAVLRGASPASASSRRAVEPPLPDDPALMKTAALSAGDTARGAGSVLLGFAADQIAQGYAAVYPILSRVAWGAKPRHGAPIPMRPTHVTIHHTDGRQTMTEAETIAEVRQIQAFHMGRERGWDDIAYHFLIDGAGRVVEGRPAQTLGAHVLGGNEDNIGIAMMGDFEKVHPTQAQVESLERLVSYLAVTYKQDPSQRGFVQPHRHYNNTDCPGANMMTIFEAVRRDIDGETKQILAREGAEPGRFQPVAVVATVGA